jgi:hypothetical protein
VIPNLRDEFLSEEDLDIRNLPDEELSAWWDEWLRVAQATNAFDRDTFSHGVFVLMDEPHAPGV